MRPMKLKGTFKVPEMPALRSEQARLSHKQRKSPLPWLYGSFQGISGFVTKTQDVIGPFCTSNSNSFQHGR